ncbi:MAG: L-2-hydroxyglutarate oxidase [Bacteroidetes bacterium]|nr:L-2-hydroxyglutarate oxidase [Bacteroidota bacterium]
MSTSCDVLIIGGGIVGLAAALRLRAARPALRILLLEKEGDVARHQTGHNSGVLHSGIYYRPGSLKASNCVRGYRQMLRFCEEHGIRHEVCGKIIVATDEQELPRLEVLRQRGEANGLDGVRELSREELREREPHVNGLRGLLVPQTGIVDFGEVSRVMAAELRRQGVEIRFHEPVTALIADGSVTTVVTPHGEYSASCVVGCAGLHSDRVAMLSGTDPGVRIIPFRGEYYTLKEHRRHLVNHLIYPVPDPAFPFLGVHFTRMIGGGVEAGPNAVFAFAREGYTYNDIDLRDLFDAIAWPGFRRVAARYWRTGIGEYRRSLSKRAFVRALQKLVPEITEEDLTAGGSGVRAQACDADGSLLDDFSIMERGNAIHVCNAPSPAATSSLSIGDTIAEKALVRLPNGTK